MKLYSLKYVLDQKHAGQQRMWRITIKERFMGDKGLLAHRHQKIKARAITVRIQCISVRGLGLLFFIREGCILCSCLVVTRIAFRFPLSSRIWPPKQE